MPGRIGGSVGIRWRPYRSHPWHGPRLGLHVANLNTWLNRTRMAAGDGWDDPDYQPTHAELQDPIILEVIDGDTPEGFARAIFKFKPPTPDEWP